MWYFCKLSPVDCLLFKTHPDSQKSQVALNDLVIREEKEQWVQLPQQSISSSKPCPNGSTLLCHCRSLLTKSLNYMLTCKYTTKHLPFSSNRQKQLSTPSHTTALSNLKETTARARGCALCALCALNSLPVDHQNQWKTCGLLWC